MRRSPLPKRPSPRVAVLAAAALSSLGTAASTPQPGAAQDAGAGDVVPAPFSAELLSDMRFRSVGPAVTGGRIHDVEALPDDPSTVYVASASGGLWKTTNQGTTWRPIFDHQPVSAFGDVAVAPSDPEVLYAGTGEQQNRQSSTWGDGVYRSDDGGDTWTHLGLAGTRHVGEVIVHPENPDVAWVAAVGDLWRGGGERGVYRTRDGGETWEQVLAGENRFTGAVDLAVSPSDPDVLYAAMYQRLRRTWGFNGGGPGSGIWKSTDGGESWRELTEGLPGGEKGRIGIAASRADADRLYALVEHAERPGTYRSDDAGETWERVNELNPRPMYYSHVVADPVDPDRLYVLATEAYTSADGGRTFRRLPTRPTYDVGVHSDHHAMWIDPSNPEHFYLAGDAGLHETFDRGETYRRVHNLPIGQFYAIGLDARDPYRIYGGMQDNHSWMGPSATRRWKGILGDDWKQTGFGDGMYQQPDPTSHRFVYVGAQNGALTRVDARTGDRLELRPRPPMPVLGSPGDTLTAAEVEASRDGAGAADGDGGPPEMRFDWVTPSLVSLHDPSTVYFGGNRLFVTRDRGDSWKATIDLTKRIDRDTLPLMGVPGSRDMLSKHDGTATYSEITTVHESPVDPGVVWVGTDDGNVQVTRDGGRSWREVGRNVWGEGGAAPGLAATTYVSRVTASAGSPGTAWAAFDAHRRGDVGTHLFRTRDYGRSWTRVDGGFPAGAGPVNDVVEHPDRPGLLFAGTEHGLFVSPDGGGRWARLGAGGGEGEGRLPTTLYDDLAIHPRAKDLVAGTHGRSLWILDDTSPLARWTETVADRPLHLFAPRPATLFHYWKSTSYRGQMPFTGENPPFGALLTYHLAEDADAARIVVRSADGDTVRTLDVPGGGGVLNRVTWDLRHEPPPTEEDDGDEPSGEVGKVVEPDTVLPAPSRPLEPAGPLVSPGLYTLTLQAGELASSATLRVEGDPRMPVTDEQWHQREAFLVGLLGLQRRAFEATRRAEALRDSLEAARDTAAGDGRGGGRPPEGDADRDGDGPRPPLEAAGAVADRLDEVRDDLYGLASAFNREGVTQGTVYPPTRTHRHRRQRLAGELEAAVAELEDLEERIGRAQQGDPGR